MSKILCYDSYGRILNFFYQWDVNQTITIKGVPPSTATEVHFCTHGDEMALVAAISVFDDCITVDVPNILLQQDSPIFMYLYRTSNESGKTIHFIQIPVRRRAKPENYVYTESEILNYTTLDARITALEKFSGIGDASMVWTINGKTGDVVLTPEDIGAIPKDAVIVNALSNLDIENLINGLV